MDGMYPPTSPPPLKRKPVNLQNLPPQVQAALAQGQPYTAEDGSVIYPDGTSTGAGDSPDDFALGQAVDYGPGGFNSSPMLGGPGAQGGYPPTAPPAPADPFASPVFDAFNKTMKRGMPGQPPKQDGLTDPLAGSDGTQPSRNVQLAVEGPKVTYDGGGPTGGKDSTSRPMYGGRIGRRRSTPISQSRARR